MSTILPSEVVKTSDQTDFTVIWMHGLGADGNDFVPIIPELKLPENLKIKFIFPHAPVRPITLNNGYEMRAWFDMTSLDRADNAKEDDILTSVSWINTIINQEIDKGTEADHIILAGFSQGGVIALQAGLRFSKKLAGIMALSTYMPFSESLLTNPNIQQQNGNPIFAAHGINDPVIPILSWEDYVPKLESKGFAVEARSYVMEHSVSLEEIQHISTWLQQVCNAQSK